MTKKILPESTLNNCDSRFLNVVDIIIRKNRESGVTPDTERSLSILIGPDSTSIAKIRRGERNPTLQQITNLGNHFNLDFNYFFRRKPFRYELYNDKIFLLEIKEELISRMKMRFKEEVVRFRHVILIFREEIEKLEKEKGNSPTVKQSQKMLQEAREKINKAFSKN